MPYLNQRRAHRIPCELPTRIYGSLTDLDAQVLDLSRTGLRIRLPLDALGVEEAGDMLALARAVDRHMGPRFNLDLNHVALGPLLRKRVHLVRIGEAPLAEGLVELGCEFRVPLSDDESGVLELDLPAIEVAHTVAVRAGPPARRFAAYLHPSAGWGGRKLAGTTPGLEDGTALFMADGSARLAVPDLDVTTVARALAGSFGPRPVLEIRDGTQCVWAGPTRVRQIETAAPRSREMRVEVEAVAGY